MPATPASMTIVILGNVDVKRSPATRLAGRTLMKTMSSKAERLRRFITAYAEKSQSWSAEKQPEYREWIEWATRGQTGSIHLSPKSRLPSWIGSTNSADGDLFETRSLQLPRMRLRDHFGCAAWPRPNDLSLCDVPQITDSA